MTTLRNVGMAAALLIPISLLGQAAPDTTRIIPMAPVEVTAPRKTINPTTPMSAQKIYADDAYKALTYNPQITSAAPFSALLNLHGLPIDQGARPYLWGHKIVGKTTLLFGGYSIVNPDVMDIELRPFLMSHQFTETNGALEFRPRPLADRPTGLVISSDGIERRGTLSISPSKNTRVVTSVRQNDVIGLLEAIEALKVIPQSLDTQTLAEFKSGGHTLKGFVRVGREKNNWKDTLRGSTGSVLENNFQNLAFVQYDLALPKGLQFGLGASWEKNGLDANRQYNQYREVVRARSEVFNPRITVATENHKYTFWLGQTYATSDWKDTHRYSRTDGGVEGRILYGQFTFQPSVSAQQFQNQTTFLHGMTVSVHPKRTTIIFGYGTYADYFVYDNGLFGSVYDQGGATRPQRSNQYAVTVEYKPEHQPLFNFVRVSAVKKDLDIVRGSERNQVPLVAGDVTLAKIGKFNYEVAYAHNRSSQDGGPLIGSTRHVFRAGMGVKVRSHLNLSVEANYRDGMVQDNRDQTDPHYGERYKLDPATYVNVAANERIQILGRPMDITLTLFNVGQFLGNRAEIARAGSQSYTSPFWGNIRFRWDLFK